MKAKSKLELKSCKARIANTTNQPKKDTDTDSKAKSKVNGTYEGVDKVNGKCKLNKEKKETDTNLELKRKQNYVKLIAEAKSTIENEEKKNSLSSKDSKHEIDLNPDRLKKAQGKDKLELEVDSKLLETNSKDLSFINIIDYFKAELVTSEYDPEYEVKRERIYNFFTIPKQFEKFIAFGCCVCLNSVLYHFTILPFRIFISLWVIITSPITRRRLSTNQRCDLIRGALIIITTIFLSYLDLSRLYHTVRGQSMVKLYVIFNMLEIFDRLLASLGQDLLNTYLADVTLGYPHHHAQESGGRSLSSLFQFLFATLYVPLHTLVLLYQMLALNVSVNSYNDSLLSLLMSNQFIEIKGSVFKKFERENLFQLACADIVERFQLILFLSIITVRNTIQMWNESSSTLASSTVVLPNAFNSIVPNSLTGILGLMISPAVLVLLCELCVDWIKHGFVTKFNHIRPTVYDRYLDLLCKDLVVTSPTRIVSKPSFKSNQTLIDQSPVVARRLGLSVLPLVCIIIRIIIQLLGMRGYPIQLIRFQLETLPSYLTNTIQQYFSWFIQLIESHVQYQISIWDSFTLTNTIHHMFNTIQSFEVTNLVNFAKKVLVWSYKLPINSLKWLSGFWDSNTVLYIATGILVFVSLTLVKLLLGIFLLRYANSRLISSTNSSSAFEREIQDLQQAKIDNNHKFKELNRIKDLLKDSEHLDVYRPSNLSLETVDRFSLFKSRVP